CLDHTQSRCPAVLVPLRYLSLVGNPKSLLEGGSRVGRFGAIQEQHAVRIRETHARTRCCGICLCRPYAYFRTRGLPFQLESIAEREQRVEHGHLVVGGE